MNPSNELNRMVGDALREYASDLPVSASNIADTVIRKIDKDEKAPVLVRYGCILELRQMARSLLRREFDDKNSESQDDFFGGLQDRYPAAGYRKGQYLPRYMMTIADYDANITRLENEAQAKQKHADALRAERDERIRNNDIAA